MIRLLLATRNAHKTRELAEMLGADFVIEDLRSIPGATQIEETGATFEENAILKATAISRVVEGWVVADDSGLEVDALVGAPGIFSARYAGASATDHENVRKLLSELSDVPALRRSARFRCVLALARNDRLHKTYQGTVEGSIAFAPSGNHGFGYDPIFIPTGSEKTFAELPAEVKRRISHRAEAAAKLREALSAMRGVDQSNPATGQAAPP